MKKILALLMAVLMIAACFTGCGANIDEKVITVGYTDYAPMNYPNNYLRNAFNRFKAAH